uniref:Protein YjdM C-terminal domain-containing protein n=1 Tax=Grammatophora oceanica TaxID=210454 RepID=A0A7S1UMY5_9STRA|mmetsp:Transcript_13099/g.19315  ORF Transcript_13099/g.19315 Transcript_13099/m.19315 type:complete len:195 (+) Transcript_13099:147-731(+)|eukprot:CAMPEP_0194059366 /NCGR_PEP_ID=MMETSP0009_2-20130614/68809_1 /TAXON_ID=210454 /ORGANISM="Grammatophora oceanica, Strain CCMP 410" /LENGTH=194 /DNA_ID=CAMNT_0038709895 /DNA_START=142 /DNA_END=726 /DNA_ORIENTATION=-
MMTLFLSSRVLSLYLLVASLEGIRSFVFSINNKNNNKPSLVATKQRHPACSLPSAFAVAADAFQTFCPTSTRLFAAYDDDEIPEPGPCPECGDEATYWDGSDLFICTACEHEWSAVKMSTTTEQQGDDEVRDVNGNVLESGDTCILTQALAKGKLKRGLKVKIRLGDYGDGHDCQATIKGLGTYDLKSQFLKKV